jgi:hypothetical protein
VVIELIVGVAEQTSLLALNGPLKRLELAKQGVVLLSWRMKWKPYPNKR